MIFELAGVSDFKYFFHVCEIRVSTKGAGAHSGLLPSSTLFIPTFFSNTQLKVWCVGKRRPEGELSLKLKTLKGGVGK